MLSRGEWRKTPYNDTTADTDRALARLLSKYEIEEYQWAQGKLNDRPAVSLRFILRGKPYKIQLSTLDADADRDELVAQVKRAIYYSLKSMLEFSSVFIAPEQALFAFLEIQEGVTLYELAAPRLSSLTAGSFMKLLPPPR